MKFLFKWYYLILIVFATYILVFVVINTTITKEELIGKYVYKFNKDEQYKLELFNDDTLSITKNKITVDGTWYCTHKNTWIKSKIKSIDGVDLFLGGVEKNIFTKKIKIEALSMGLFHGSEDNAYFIRE